MTPRCKCGGKLRRCKLRPSRNGGVRCFHCVDCEGVSALNADGRPVRGSFGVVTDAGDAVRGHAQVRRGGQTGERGVCPKCGKDVALRVPKGGDGTETRPVHHTAWAPYGGRWSWRRCPGVDVACEPAKPDGWTRTEGVTAAGIAYGVRPGRRRR